MASLNDMMIIARSGVLSHQERMAVISHNIVNVNTPGYHRQTAVLGTTPPQQPNLYFTRPYDIGSGVRVVDVKRIYDDVKVRVLRDQQSSTEYHTVLAEGLPDLEALMGTTDDGSLTNNLEKFWQAWQDVATQPENITMREVLLQRSQSLADSFTSLTSRIDRYRDQIASGTSPDFTGIVPTTVNDVNDLASRIGNLNALITRAEAMGINKNDLMDQRDQLVSDLSSLVNISVASDYTITIDGQTLVSGDGATLNTMSVTAVDPAVTFSLDGGATAVNVTGGSLAGWSQLAAITDTLRGDIDVMAAELISAVNTIHMSGYDLDGNPGIEFFVGTTGDTIAVNPLLANPANPLLDNPQMVAAATTLHDPGPPAIPNVSDGTAALAIADLCHSKMGGLLNQTFGAFFTSLSTAIGAQIVTEEGAAADGANIVSLLENAIQSESGVNLDEEMIDLMSAQRAFEAASRLVTTVDRMMDVIINRMG